MLSEDEFERARRGARRGDARSFASLWRAYQPEVVRYLTAVSGPAAGDLAAETWVDVVRGLHRFRGGETRFRRLLFTTARRRWLDRRRTRHAGRPAPGDPAEIVALQSASRLDDRAVARITGCRRGTVRKLSRDGANPLSARTPLTDVVAEHEAVRSFHAARLLRPAEPPPPIARRLAVASVVVTAGLAAATGLAAADALPAPVQRAASTALSAVGIDVPDGGDPAPPAPAGTDAVEPSAGVDGDPSADAPDAGSRTDGQPNDKADKPEKGDTKSNGPPADRGNSDQQEKDKPKNGG